MPDCRGVKTRNSSIADVLESERLPLPSGAPVASKKLSGNFIAFDGNEGRGKSTQARLLREYLDAQGVEVLPVHDPGATRIGELIRAILLNPENTDMGMRCEMLLYMASRAQMMHEKI